MSALIDALINENLTTGQQLQDAKDKQLGAKKPLQELLVEMGFIKENDLLRVSSRIFNMPVFDLTKETIDTSVAKLLSYETAKKYGVFAVRKEQDTLILAMSDPQDIFALADIGLMSNMSIKPLLAAKSQISDLIEKHYQSDDALYDLFKNFAEDIKVEIVKEDAQDKDLSFNDGLADKKSPVVRLVNLILNDAAISRASDIHIEPQENFIDVRYRIDGELKNIMKIPRQLHSRLCARIKIMGQLDLAETRKPQDGRTKILVNGRKVDIRISIIPTHYGEKVALRLLDPNEAKVELAELGFQEKELDTFVDAIKKPQGMVLVTGPTGSGKTSTLYATLNFIKGESKNIISIEDPIEYLIEGINQIQINPIKDVTFATGLRSILRQDPNVILVGEIRDKETADIAFRSSLTGHLVFSTLHTNNSIASITRLMDIGLKPYVIASSIILIVSQRLIRLICPHCKEQYCPDQDLIDKTKRCIAGHDSDVFYRGRGCEKCNFSGFLGRTAVFEMLKITPKIKDLITDGAAEGDIFREAKNGGLRSLSEAAMARVAMGLTPLEEILKVADIMEEDKIPEESKVFSEKSKILVVDDEEDILRVLQMRLRTAGYEVIQARNGKEGVEYCVREKPDLIVMDVMMPKMDGLEATRLLRSKLQTATIPILMLTAKKDKESELQGLDAGADDYMSKPFDSDKLLARIKMLLRRKR